MYEATSLVPFGALLSGRQSWRALASEVDFVKVGSSKRNISKFKNKKKWSWSLSVCVCVQEMLCCVVFACFRGRFVLFAVTPQFSRC